MQLSRTCESVWKTLDKYRIWSNKQYMNWNREIVLKYDKTENTITTQERRRINCRKTGNVPSLFWSKQAWYQDPLCVPSLFQFWVFLIVRCLQEVLTRDFLSDHIYLSPSSQSVIWDKAKANHDLFSIYACLLVSSIISWVLPVVLIPH